MIKSTVSQAPGIFVLKPIDNNLSTSGQSQLIPACAVYASKGPVGVPVQVTADTWQDVFGRPLPMNAGEQAEGLRQLKDALEECSYAMVTRVMPDDAKYPSVALIKPSGDEGVGVSSAHAYGADPDPVANAWLQVWPVDGDPSTARKVHIESIDSAKGRFTLKFTETVNSAETVLESFTVGINPDDLDDLGQSAYAPVVLENALSRFRCTIDTVDFADVKVLSADFTGGTNGSAVTTDNWKAAWDLFKSDDVDFTHGFAAGCYDVAVIPYALKICADRLAQFKLDAPPSMTETAAVAWLEGLNIDDYQAQVIHYPYKALDEWYGGKSVWGASGALIAAKARCYQTPTGNAAVPGVHYAPAGDKRGRISRRNIVPLHTAGQLTGEALVAARLTPVAKGTVINDTLNLWSSENYLRFEHVVAIHNDLCHEFIAGAANAKFEPDGLTEQILTNICTAMGDARVSAGAFVTPRNPDTDGEAPYVVTIKQKEIDLWQVDFSFCPTGVARRIALQPILIK